MCLTHEGAVRTVLVAGWDRRLRKELVTKALDAEVAADTAAAPCPTGITGQGSRRGQPCSVKSSPRPRARRKPDNRNGKRPVERCESSDVAIGPADTKRRVRDAEQGFPSICALRKKSISLVHAPFRRPAPPSLFQSWRMNSKDAERQMAKLCLKIISHEEEVNSNVVIAKSPKPISKAV